MFNEINYAAKEGQEGTYHDLDTAGFAAQDQEGKEGTSPNNDIVVTHLYMKSFSNIWVFSFLHVVEEQERHTQYKQTCINILVFTLFVFLYCLDSRLR